MTSLLVVESPAKSKTLSKYLGKGYTVLASMGHIRDLPSKTGSVDTEHDFKMKYEVSEDAQKNVNALVSAMKKADKLILATDPDREGEAIAWHIVEALKEKRVLGDKPIERVVFNAITKNSVLQAVENPRKIDKDLVNAQQARRALDYLVGFNLSPVLWRKLPGSKSAGRVQSVALRLICEREAEIEKFKSEEYWDIKVDLKTKEKEELTATVTHINDKKLEKFDIKTEKEAEKIEKELKDKSYEVTKVEKKQTSRKPYAPFTTSTLQQEAARKLGFSAKKTMMVAQKLYEGVETDTGTHGLITYMRTDGVYTAPEAIEATRKFIKKEYGDKYLPESPILYESKIKNAQEAHEAIRPTNPLFTPKSAKNYLDKDQFALYELIWKRLIASQMSNVILDQVIVTIVTKKEYAQLKAVGSVINFDGFYILYNEGKDEDDENEKERKLPQVEEGEELKHIKTNKVQHFTEPPARYSEATLVKTLESLGIGRPSTYASIISVLQAREYVELIKRRFHPEARGRVVNEFLMTYFKQYVEYDYTAKLEDDLDEISNGKEDWKKFLEDFWKPFEKSVKSAMKLKIEDVLDKLDDQLDEYIFGLDKDGKIDNKCPECKKGKLRLKTSRFGMFLGCDNYPECKFTRNIGIERERDEAQGSEEGKPNKEAKKYENFEPKLLAKNADGQDIYLKKGPYGFYVEQENLKTEDKKAEATTKPTAKTEKPKRVGVPRNMDISKFTIKDALDLLSLPKIIGKHDEKEMKVGIGRFGPFILHDNKFYSIPKTDDFLTLTPRRAVEIMKQKIERQKKGGFKKGGFRKGGFKKEGFRKGGRIAGKDETKTTAKDKKPIRKTVKK